MKISNMNTRPFDALAFGQKIKRLRKAKGLSQEELAVAINKTVDTVSNVERGISLPRLETVHDLASALDVQIYELFDAQDLGRSDQEKIRVLEKITSLLKGQPIAVLELAQETVAHIVSLQQRLTSKSRK